MRSKDVFGVYPFQVGCQEAWVLHDGFLWGEPIQQYAVGVPDPEIAALFEPHFLNPERIQLGLNPILFRWENKLALVDTGIGSVVGEPTGLLEQRLSALGIQPDDIEVVFLTHLHIDHVGGLLDRANKKSRFPRARVFISQTEIEFWQVPNPDVSELRNVPSELIDLTIQCAHDALEILVKQIEPFALEAELLPGVHSVPLPGHTPGQSGYLFQSEESRFLVIGDAMHDAVLHVERPEWTSMGDARRQQTVDTRLNVLTRLANERLRFHTYHFPFPGIGYIRKNGEDGFGFEPERWTWI
jgi:glyoxylase-like metal-dependent hydrolase (beta-lactamase superfamily II)